MTYQGYSFSAQTISELGAIGSPFKPLVDPLFLTYDVLMVALSVETPSANGPKPPITEPVETLT